jgi:glycosyltransferase involved in cell wall biosynthesis
MNYLKGKLVGDFGEKCHLVYHGVDISKHRFAGMPEYSGTLKLVSVGRFTRTKGFHRLVEAVARVRDLGIDVELTLVGDGKLRPNLKQLATSLGVSNKVHFAGWVTHENVQIWIRAAHLFAILPDRDFDDGLPNVVLEAMALGRPIVISPLPAASEAIVSDETGWILSRCDGVDELVGILSMLKKNPTLLGSMGRNAHDFAVNNYDRRYHIRLLETLFLQSRND